jgi:acetoacetyl-CoA reductase/3-oxoacyl-[acyl-carrier protein] reductase
MINALLPKMREQNFGRIINFASIVAQSGIPGTSAYAASKAGLWGMTKAIAVENATKGITINNLNLGYFDIGMIQDVPVEMQEVIKSKIPGKQFGNPDDIFKVVKYLSAAAYITGTSVDVNGGLF